MHRGERGRREERRTKTHNDLPTWMVDLNPEGAAGGPTVSALFLQHRPLIQVGRLCLPHAFVLGKSPASPILLLSQQIWSASLFLTKASTVWKPSDPPASDIWT